MTDNVAKISKIILWVLIALSVFFALMLFINGSDYEASADKNTADITWINNGINYTMILLIVTAAVAVIASLYIFVMIMMAKPKRALIKLIPIALLGIILLIAYTQASDIPLNMPNYEGSDNVAGPLKWSGTGLFITYGLLALAVLSILYVEISRLFK